ncbi:uncharacterized protein LOC112528072 [Cynara cardunculus var. scolymus]|uniref:Uncharacterized protein n=1 Tax=Cynara cardunculus var. scolymus TaxID=59895 RepID=A0A103XSY1_CYNCS|nr:uncharacterized protein LOC112528072 [Cynara cardunculus var. scolymus]KVH96305.1 hypothetical protein Ccrd_001620 [Cynara cardunculus var. scolymus]
MESLSNKKRVRSDSDESEFNSPEAKRIRDDLLDTLDDSDVCTVGQDLDSFIKSFQDEISPPPETVDLASESGESRPDLEFLFEASDDELGLPPTGTTPNDSERIPVSTESVEVGEFCWLDDQIPNYDSFEYGFDYAAEDVNFNNNHNGEYVALDGLFDYTDLGFGSSDLSRRPESLPAQ